MAEITSSYVSAAEPTQRYSAIRLSAWYVHLIMFDATAAKAELGLAPPVNSVHYSHSVPNANRCIFRNIFMTEMSVQSDKYCAGKSNVSRNSAVFSSDRTTNMDPLVTSRLYRLLDGFSTNENYDRQHRIFRVS